MVRQNTQKTGEKRQLETKTVEKDTNRNSNDRGECSGGQYRKTVSECSSIDLLDIIELDRWLMQITNKLSLEEEIEGTVEETERGKDTKVDTAKGGDTYKGTASRVERKENERARKNIETNGNRSQGIEREERNKQRVVGKIREMSGTKGKEEQEVIDKQEKIEQQGKGRELKDNRGKGQSRRVKQVYVEEKATVERRKSESNTIESKYWVERSRVKKGAQGEDILGRDKEIEQVGSIQGGRNTQGDRVQRHREKEQVSIDIEKVSSEEEMEREIVGKVIQRTKEGGRSIGKKRLVEKGSSYNRRGDSSEYRNSDEIEGDKEVDRRRTSKESNSVERSLEGKVGTDRQDTQKETQAEQKELEKVVQDRLEKRNSYGREQHSRDKEAVSECSSIDLLDIKELDRWLEKMTGKLSLKEKTGWSVHRKSP